MKNVLIACAAAAGLSVLPAVASAQTVDMVATLSGSQETPAPGVNTGASGSANVQIDVPSEELSVSLSVFNLVSPTTAAHIHVAPPGSAGPVVLDFPLPAGRTGDIKIEFRLHRVNVRPQAAIGILTMTDVIQAILTGNAYVNVHTQANGAGEIRGQLTLRR